MVFSKDNKIVCHYKVVRFIADIVRNEPKNIGIILFNTNDNTCSYSFIEEVIISKIGKELWDFNKDIIPMYFNNLPSSKEGFDKLKTNWGSMIQFDESKVLVTDDVEKELDWLSKTFVE